MTARLATLLLAAALGCSHDATPVVAPDDHPPLPESTPIGYLLDDATALHLRDDQLGKLRDLDQALAAHLDALDAGQRTPVPPSHPGPASGGPRGGGGGHRGGGMGHRRGGGGSTAGNDPPPPAAVANAAAAPASLPTESGAGSAPPPPPAMNQHTRERAADTRVALLQALSVLDPDQQPRARKVLADHGVEVDPPAPGPPEPLRSPRTSTP